MYKEDLALSNLQWLICQKTKPNQSELYLFCFLHNANSSSLSLNDKVTVVVYK